MAKIIIGIHGLANKPDKATLERWWRQSIDDGLHHIKSPIADFTYRAVHWADFLYKYPLHRDEAFKFDALYNNEPYQRPGTLQTYEDGWTDLVRAKIGSTVGPMLDALRDSIGFDPVSTALLEKKLKDLAFYYDPKRRLVGRDQQSRPARQVLIDELKNTLLPLKGHEVMVIAHSMGTIIAYDSLREIGQEDPTFEVAHFVTIGSPLGLPTVKAKVDKERSYAAVPVRTPTVVTKSWANFADRRDPVAVDSHLADDYAANDRKVQAQDNLVINDYASSTHHKSYGYLRCPEVSQQIRDFLTA